MRVFARCGLTGRSTRTRCGKAPRGAVGNLAPRGALAQRAGHLHVRRHIKNMRIAYTLLLLAATLCVRAESAGPIPATPVMVLWEALPLTTREWELLVTPTGSMEPTLRARTYLLCEPAGLQHRAAKRGDVVAFDVTAGSFGDNFARRPGMPIQTWISRVVAVAGDTVELRSGILFVNGSEVPEPYADFSANRERATASYGSVTVPPESVYVLSDNRGNSIDSRVRGTVPTAYIRGFVRYKSSAKLGAAVADGWSGV